MNQEYSPETDNFIQTVYEFEKKLQRCMEQAHLLSTFVSNLSSTLNIPNVSILTQINIKTKDPIIKNNRLFKVEYFVGEKIQENNNPLQISKEDIELFFMQENTLHTNVQRLIKEMRTESDWVQFPLITYPIYQNKSFYGLLFAWGIDKQKLNNINSTVLKIFAQNLTNHLSNKKLAEDSRSIDEEIQQEVDKRVSANEYSKDMVMHLNEILEKKLFILTCLKDLQSSVASLFEPKEIFHKSSELLRKSIGVAGAIMALPDQGQILIEGLNENDPSWETSIKNCLEQLPDTEKLKSENWENIVTGFKKTDAKKNEVYSYFHYPSYIKNQLRFIMTILLPKEKNLSDMDGNLLNSFIHQLSLYMDGALLFQKTKELDKMKSEFISVASHELRTPLVSIKAALDLFADETLGELNEEQKEYTALLERNILRLSALINDILDFSRIDSGRLQISIEKTNLTVLLKDISHTFKQQVNNKSDTLNLEIPNEEVVCQCDGNKITQVLVNFIGNSINHNKENTSITFGSELKNGRVKVFVKDDGIGIPKSEHAKIFDKFYQVKKRGAGGGAKGTGLGLAISKGLVEAHGSQLMLESDTGKGTNFFFYLPVMADVEWVEEKSKTWDFGGFKVKASCCSSIVFLEVEGLFNDEFCAHFSKIQDEFLDVWGNSLIIDLDGCSDMTSRAIGFLMEMLTNVRSIRGKMALVCNTDRILERLEAIGITKILSTQDNFNLALKKVREP